jgi:hypothetical protein
MATPLESLLYGDAPFKPGVQVVVTTTPLGITGEHPERLIKVFPVYE